MACPFTRRQFLRQGSAAVGAGLLPAAVMDAASAAPIRQYRRGGMLYRRLGQTDVYISALSFGSHTDPKYKRSSKLGQDLTEEGQARRDRLIDRAVDRGVNLVDIYNNAGQWAPMARLVKDKRDKVQVSLCRQLPGLLGDIVDRGVKLFGDYVDLYRIYLGDGDGPDGKTLEDWDVMRKAKQAGKVRAIGISTHSARMMTACLDHLEGLDYIMFPYNFIHARADYTEFLPAAIEQGVGLIAIKPLAAGSIVRLDPAARAGARPEGERVMLYQKQDTPILPEVVASLTEALGRLPDETLCQAALRFVLSRKFMTAAMPGMFQEYELDDNLSALDRHLRIGQAEHDVFDAARRVARATEGSWLPRHYRWLDRQWRV